MTANQRLALAVMFLSLSVLFGIRAEMRERPAHPAHRCQP